MRQCRGNVHNNKVVTITAVSNSQTAKNAADIEANSNHMSVDRPGQWVCFAFNAITIMPTYYSVTSTSKVTNHALVIASFKIFGGIFMSRDTDYGFVDELTTQCSRSQYYCGECERVLQRLRPEECS
jgi:hypothetical protein